MNSIRVVVLIKQRALSIKFPQQNTYYGIVVVGIVYYVDRASPVKGNSDQGLNKVKANRLSQCTLIFVLLQFSSFMH